MHRLFVKELNDKYEVRGKPYRGIDHITLGTYNTYEIASNVISDIAKAYSFEPRNKKTVFVMPDEQGIYNIESEEK